MAVKNISALNWTCLSTDVKPTLATDTTGILQAESIITETDTGNKYVTHNGTDWVLYVGGSGDELSSTAVAAAVMGKFLKGLNSPKLVNWTTY